jgi:GT2 family glycosyltransferase
LSYNSRDYQRCLESLRRLSGARVSIVVVDNGSTDGTEDMVRGDFSDFAFIQTGSNLGYTGGNNRGIDYALDHGADYVLLLNPDTELLNPSFVEEMVEYMEAHSDVGIAGPRVFLRQAGVVQNTVLFVPSFWRNLIHWVRYRFNSRFSELSGTEVVEAEVLNGVCVMLKAECLRQIGLFDVLRSGDRARG